MHARVRSVTAVVCGLLGFFLVPGVSIEAQPAVKASSAWVEAPATGASEAIAAMVIENGTMYDVYVVGAAAEVAGAVELRQAGAAGTPATVVKEIPVPAFGQLEMSPTGPHLVLRDLKQPLKAGDTVTLSIHADNGAVVSVSATVK